MIIPMSLNGKGRNDPWIRLPGGVAGDTLRVLSGRVSVRLMQAGAGLLTARLLGPEALGELAVPLLTVFYLSYLHLGVVDALGRELSLAGEDREKSRRLAAAARWFLLCLSLLLILVLIVGRALNPGLLTGRTPLFLLVLVIPPFLLQVLYYNTRAAAALNFRLVAGVAVRQGLLRVLVLVALLFLLPFRIRLYAPPLALLAAALYPPWVISRRLPAVGWRAGTAEIRLLLRVGLPLGAYAFLLMALTNGDTFLLQRLLPFADLGRFQLGNLLREGMLMAAATLGGVAVPHYARLEGAGRRADLQRLVRRHYWYFLGPAMIFTGLVFWLLKPLLTVFLPDYLPALPLLRAMVLAMHPLTLLLLPAALLIVRGEQKALVQRMFLGLSVVLILDYFLVRSADHLLLAAAASGTGTLITWLLVRRRYAALDEWRGVRLPGLFPALFPFFLASIVWREETAVPVISFYFLVSVFYLWNLLRRRPAEVDGPGELLERFPGKNPT